VNNIPMKSDETVYIVSGYMRTGTSMMMRALEAGGLETFSRSSRDDYRKRFKDEHYDPNEGGLYELESKDLTEDFPIQFKGKLIKCLMGALDKVAVMPKIKIIFMRRDTEEIRQSYQAFFGKQFDLSDDKFLPRVERTIASLLNRKDVELTVLWYRDVVQNPEQTFSDLAEKGWPIDPTKAAVIVKPELCRFKKENLVPGII
jgi:hypothetical protein